MRMDSCLFELLAIDHVVFAMRMDSCLFELLAIDRMMCFVLFFADLLIHNTISILLAKLIKKYL